MKKQTLKCRVHFVPEVTGKIAWDTTNYVPYFEVKAELGESGAFNYGNHTYAYIEVENLPKEFDREWLIDTRYVSGVKDDFEGFVKEWLGEKYGENLEDVEVLEEGA